MPSTATAGRTSFLPFCCNQAAARNAMNAGIPLFQAFSPIPVQRSTYCDCIKDGRKIDPACGSGNFLTETYLCLRKLEDKVLDELQFGQLQWSGAEEEEAGERISLSQFHGIEINDFAVSVAETALYISRLKANNDTMMLLDLDSGDLPLKESAHIVLGNALRLNWADIVPAEKCNYVMGNPPFIGYSNHNKEQEADRASIFGKVKTVDYVACWYWKAAAYMQEKPIKAAFVSTNSICQGQQVEPIWKPLFENGCHIDFAWTSFIWNSEATNQAHVHVVIVGFSYCSNVKKKLFTNGTVSYPANINGYLSAASNTFITSRRIPVCSVPEMVSGSKPTDGGNLLLSEEEKDSLIKAYPRVSVWIKPFISGKEYLNNKKRFCLWLKDVDKSDWENVPPIRDRIEAVRDMRASSSKAATRARANVPWAFGEPVPEVGDSYIVVPLTSGERRKYVPMGFESNHGIPGNSVSIIPQATIYDFGILMSQFHNAWMRAVAGRLESRYRYSNIIVYNNFVWPEPTEENRKVVENCAKAVLDARNKHHTDSLANLYDPDKMPDDLLDAHKSLDAAVEAAYGVSFQGDEEKIIAHMFKLYEKAVSKEKGSKAPANKNVSSERELKVSPHAVKVKVKVKSDRSDS